MDLLKTFKTIVCVCVCVILKIIKVKIRRRNREKGLCVILKLRHDKSHRRYFCVK